MIIIPSNNSLVAFLAFDGSKLYILSKKFLLDNIFGATNETDIIKRIIPKTIPTIDQGVIITILPPSYRKKFSLN